MTSPPHWTFADLGELTLPQLVILAHEGALPPPGRVEFRSPAEAERWLAGAAPDAPATKGG